MSFGITEITGVALAVGAVVGGYMAWKALGQALGALYRQPWYVILGVVAGSVLLVSAIWNGIAGMLVGAVWAWLTWNIYRGGGIGGDHDHVRGSELVDPKVVRQMLKGEPHLVTIGGQPIPRHLETAHFLISGGTGAGKSKTFFEIATPVRNAGKRALLLDVGGEFLSKYYQPGDIICNPFDSRSVSISPLAEMRSPWDADRIARSWIPEGHGSSKEWNSYARTIFSALLMRQWECDGSNGEILRLATRATPAELKSVVQGLPAEGLLADGNEKMLGSIMAIMASYISGLQYLDPAAGCDAFSIRDWIEKKPGEDSGWLYLSFLDGQFKALKPLIAASLDIAISQHNELLPNEARVAAGEPEYELWYFLDELSTLGFVDSLESATTKIRKVGGRLVCGLQTVAQFRESYGQYIAQTLFSCLCNWLVLRCPDAETAEAMSKHVGDQEIRRVNNSTSTSGGKVTNSQSVEFRTQRAVLPSEIQNLPNLTGVLCLNGDIPPCVVRIPVVPSVEVAERFVAKPREKKALVSTAPEMTADEETTQAEPDYEEL